MRKHITEIGVYPPKAKQKGIIEGDWENKSWEDYPAPNLSEIELHSAATNLIRRILNGNYMYCIKDPLFGERKGDNYFWFDVVQYGCNISMKDFLKMKRMPDFGDKSRKVIDIDIGDFYEPVYGGGVMTSIQGDYGVRTYWEVPEQVCYRDVDLFRKGIQKILRTAAKREIMLYEFLGGVF